MNMFSSSIFWGAVIILIGLSIILKEVFHITFPFARVVIGLVIIYFGIKVITGGGINRNARSAVFSKNNMKYDYNHNDYKILFGSGIIDFTNVNSVIKNEKREVKVVFGEAELRINENLPILVEMKTVFGSSEINGKSYNNFGNNNWASPSFDASQPHIKIESDVVFGRLNVVTAQHAW